jgi:hypothetical protein
MNKKHLTTTEKANWRASQRNLGQQNVILPEDYHPETKAPSRRDLIRAGARTRKFSPA